jgi:chaperonin cofactor prefoldin
MKPEFSQHHIEAAAQRAVDNNAGLTELQKKIDGIDSRIRTLQDERTELRKQQRSIMQKAITQALHGGA